MPDDVMAAAKIVLRWDAVCADRVAIVFEGDLRIGPCPGAFPGPGRNGDPTFRSDALF